MAAVYQTRFILRAIVVALACVVLNGCQSFDFESDPLQADPVAPTEVIGQYQMQLLPKWGQPSVEKVNITGPVTVQDALVASGATKKFGAMKITLGRIVKDKGTLLKLPVEYVTRAKTVKEGQDYQILPGDTITVSPKKSNTIDKLLKSASGGLL